MGCFTVSTEPSQPVDRCHVRARTCNLSVRVGARPPPPPSTRVLCPANTHSAVWTMSPREPILLTVPSPAIPPVRGGGGAHSYVLPAYLDLSLPPLTLVNWTPPPRVLGYRPHYLPFYDHQSTSFTIHFVSLIIHTVES